MRLGGIGTIWSVPSITTSSSPIPLAIAKSVSIDCKQERKPLRGQWMDPIDMLAGARDISIKLSNCDFRAATMQMVMQGMTLAGGSTKNVAVAESGTIPGTPYQITVTNSATWSEDGGVFDLTAGKWLSRVTSSPATGQYSVAAGVYTYAAADTTHNVTATYTYTSATAGSQIGSLAAQAVGPSTGYIVRVFTPTLVAGVVKSLGLEFPNVHFSDIGWALKNDDWSEQSLTGTVAQDAGSSNVCKIYVGE